MRTIFELSSAEYRDLKSEGLQLQVGGATFLITVQARQKRQPLTRPMPRVIPKRRVFPARVKAKILKDADGGVAAAARKYQISRSVIDRWRREKAAA
jgi:hypothetical protein